jgi:hypothetical protein
LDNSEVRKDISIIDVKTPSYQLVTDAAIAAKGLSCLCGGQATMYSSASTVLEMR